MSRDHFYAEARRLSGNVATNDEIIESSDPNVSLLRRHWGYDSVNGTIPVGDPARNIVDGHHGVYTSNTADIAVANSPFQPRTNGKCEWNGGLGCSNNDCCYPMLPMTDAERDAAIPGGRTARENSGTWDPDIDGPSFGLRHQLWSPVYSPSIDGAELCLHNDLRSSLATLGGGRGWSSAEMGGPWNVRTLAYQYEHYIDEDHFFDPVTSSNTYKLARFYRNTSSTNNDNRFTDFRARYDSTEHRIQPDGGAYNQRTVQPPIDLQFVWRKSEYANTWLRFTYLVSEELDLNSYDVRVAETGEQIWFWERANGARQVNNYAFGQLDNNITQFLFREQSTSHQADSREPDSPQMYFRNLIIASAPIQPVNDLTPPPEPESRGPERLVVWLSNEEREINQIYAQADGAERSIQRIYQVDPQGGEHIVWLPKTPQVGLHDMLAQDDEALISQNNEQMAATTLPLLTQNTEQMLAQDDRQMTTQG